LDRRRLETGRPAYFVSFRVAAAGLGVFLRLACTGLTLFLARASRFLPQQRRLGGRRGGVAS
jgi:hypothetical protein